MIRRRGRVVRGLAVSLVLLAAPGARATQGSSPPSFTYAEASGCGGLLVYAWNEARTEVLTLRVDDAVLSRARGTTELRIEREADRVQVAVEMTDEERSSLQFCSNERTLSAERPVVWVGTSGRVKITMARRGGAPLTSTTVAIEDLVVRAPAGDEVRARRGITFTAAISLASP